MLIVTASEVKLGDVIGSSPVTGKELRDGRVVLHYGGGWTRHSPDEDVKVTARADTAAARLFSNGRTQPLTAVEEAFFGRPDHMVRVSMKERESIASINIEIRTRERLRKVLMHDNRFNSTNGNAIGYTEFINRALDALECE
jgi:hypothetical protein